MKFIFSLLLLTLFFSCSKGKAKGNVLSHDQMEAVLWEQMKANAYAAEFVARDTSKNPAHEDLVIQEKIFQKYHTTKEEFYRSYNYYVEHSEELKMILDSITSKESRLHQQGELKNAKTDSVKKPALRRNTPLLKRVG